MSVDEDEVPKLGPTYINPNKKYGLIIPNKTSVGSKLKTATSLTNAKQVKTLVKPCIFDEDEDDDDDEMNGKSIFQNEKKHIASTNTSANRIKKETQLEIEKALSVDPNVFEYDEIYDKMEEQKAILNPKLKNQNESKEPKYIAGIMKAAAKRKMEFEKLQERKIQSEREKEGDLWKDKEVFVTTAYRKKMEERQLLEEEERRQDQIESLLDVKKAKDLSGFYSNMLKIKSGEMVIEEEAEKEKRLLKEIRAQKNYRIKKDISDEENEEEEEQVIKEENLKKETDLDKDEVLSDEEEKKISDKEAFKEPLPKKPKEETEEKGKPKTDTDNETKEVKEAEKENEQSKLSKEERMRLRREKLFTKRTVGEKLNEEISDYFMRKNQILSAKSYIERE